ncbi:TetR family transcriptional regulator [Sphingobium yanoikuyae]
MSIAPAAGVAEGTLFVYFRTKDELFNQLHMHLSLIALSFGDNT